MKPKLITITFALVFSLSAGSYAQQAALAPDQNPGSERSRARYMNMADSLTNNEGTTVQQTYQAYDWYEAREARRAVRREQNARSAWYFPSSFGFRSYNNWDYGNWGYGSWGRRDWRRSNFWLGW